MQREIKFRAWDKHLSSFITDLEFLSQGYWDYDGSPIFIAECEEGDYSDNEDSFEDTFILQQYTGLKDKNGKEIYEGDIVSKQKTSDDDFANVGHIFFAAGTFMIDGDGPLYEYTKSLTPDILEDYVVVGNVFENKNEL